MTVIALLITCFQVFTHENKFTQRVGTNIGCAYMSNVKGFEEAPLSLSSQLKNIYSISSVIVHHSSS